ncbi:hypothetical protein [Catenulispora sp. GP43]|uniref:hypothetical protein n=1 Tax=Catenulispora sp. GP43 TaxID=3156263 RepID=UPI003514F12A
MSPYFLERIAVTVRFEVAGAVIDEAPEGLVLRCLAHNFDFSLTTGLCLNARCEPIVVAASV